MPVFIRVDWRSFADNQSVLADPRHGIAAGGRALGTGKFVQLTGAHFQQPVGVLEVVIIVADGDHGMAGCGKGRQELVIEHAPKGRVLIRGPLVQQQDLAQSVQAAQSTPPRRTRYRLSSRYTPQIESIRLLLHSAQ